MDGDYWGDPEEFRPDRFLTPEGTLRKDERFIPFGRGKSIFSTFNLYERVSCCEN